ncbi:hypothetical protein Taro_032122 [Colocasia esculenta]|uniref:Uncharacterized protein n=1 Tax=Colocasia esculenta TaxID=4460 RepID=A0A843VYE6_COLES|nr:hypothetical protein [Colocasia esculenta]
MPPPAPPCRRRRRLTPLPSLLLVAMLLLLLLLLLLCFSSQPASAAGRTVTHLPGFHAPLSFHLETGLVFSGGCSYVGVDDHDDVQLFYYFIQSERDPADDPLLLWLTGGPGCSALSGLAFEIGPITFHKARYDGSLPTLVLRPNSWTKVANIIFLDSPVGTGFSYSRNPEGFKVGDMSSSRQVVTFLRKWLEEHPQFISNPFYVAADSYAGKVTPIIAHLISEDMENGEKPVINLKGYLIGNAITGERFDYMSRIPFLHGMGIISDELYKSTMDYCEGQDYDVPETAKCAEKLNIVKQFLSELSDGFILDPKCPFASPRPEGTKGERRSLCPYTGQKKIPPPDLDVECRTYSYYLSYYWANNNLARQALHIHEGTVNEWQRCNLVVNQGTYTQEIESVIKFHLDLTTRGYRALVYNGDHDPSIPFQGTLAWIKSLNFSVVEDWRSWFVDGQVAGYTMLYSNNLTFATVKGAGHTAPEYKSKECLAMLQRWVSHKPL